MSEYRIAGSNSVETEEGGIPQESRCVEGYLHAYRITEQDEDCVFETCRRCGRRQHFKVIDGTVENINYLNHHIQQALTPDHPGFYREWFFEKEILREFIYD